MESSCYKNLCTNHRVKDIVSADSRSIAGEYISGSQFWVFVHFASLDSSRTTRRRGRPQKNHVLHFSAVLETTRLIVALLSMVEAERCEFWTSASKILATALRKALNSLEFEYKKLNIFTPHVDACLRYNPSELGPDTYPIVKAFALLYSKIGRWMEAAKMNKDWLDKNKEKLGDESSHVLACMEEMAFNCFNLDRTSEIIELRQHILEVKLRVLGDNHREVLEARQRLAIGLKFSQPQKAVELLEHVSKTRRRDLGEEHPDTLSAITHLADGYRMCDRPQDALKVHTQVYNIRKRLLGEAHLDTIYSIIDLAITHASIDRFQDAVVLLERAVELRKNLQGGRNPELLDIMYFLVLAYFYDKQFQDATHLAEQLVKLSKEILGDEHPTTLRSEELLAMCVSPIELQSHKSELKSEFSELDSESNAPEREINELDSRFSQQGKRSKHWWSLRTWKKPLLHEGSERSHEKRHEPRAQDTKRESVETEEQHSLRQKFT